APHAPRGSAPRANKGYRRFRRRWTWTVILDGARPEWDDVRCGSLSGRKVRVNPCWRRIRFDESGVPTPTQSSDSLLLRTLGIDNATISTGIAPTPRLALF